MLTQVEYDGSCGRPSYDGILDIMENDDDLRAALRWTALFDAIGGVAIVLLALAAWVFSSLLSALLGAFVDDADAPVGFESFLDETALGVIACMASSLAALAVLPGTGRPVLRAAASSVAGTIIGASTLLLLLGVNPLDLL